MKVVIAIDSFKVSLTSIEAGIAAAEGFKRADKRIECKGLYEEGGAAKQMAEKEPWKHL